VNRAGCNVFVQILVITFNCQTVIDLSDTRSSTTYSSGDSSVACRGLNILLEIA